ncbi:MAG: hypothetical protein Lokiarch_16060 [Candidatus Lokiarchaeum sp. GC14_75]|nr:MAG: hypothetical protein Lokiarch_16060 [Candidatus Lokiarchaeum sp. GC14_75]
MNDFKIKLYKILFYIKIRIKLFLFIFSLFCLLYVFLNLIGLSILLFRPITLLSTIFIILFLPSYPIFYIIFQKKRFTFLEKLSLTIVIDLIFFIFLGYFGSFLGIPITGGFFFCGIIICYLAILLYIAYFEVKTNKYDFFKVEKIQHANNKRAENFSLSKYLKNLIPLNGFFLIIFIFLICILNVVRVSYFGGTDPWLHILNSRIITKFNFIPFENYHKTMGLNIFEAVITFFSGVDHALIPRYFVFYTFFLSSLIFYNISLRIFKNQHLAIFSVFILEFSSLGFSIMMIQYWPSGLSLIMCLMVFFLLYNRLQNFVQLEPPIKRIILKNIISTYILITLIFVGAILTHVITAAIFLFSFLWLYLIYFLKDQSRGIDFIFLLGLLLVFLLFIAMGIGSDHFRFFIPQNIPWYFLPSIGIAGIVSGAFILWKILKTIDFTKGKFKSTIKGKKYNKLEKKVVIPFIYIISTLLMISILILNIIWFDFKVINILNTSEIVLFSALSFWGLIIFQKKPKGKILLIWGSALVILLLLGLIFNIFAINVLVWERILYLLPPIIVIGFISYIYKLIKSGSIKNIRLKLFILGIITFSLFTTYFNESSSFEIFTMKKREVSTLQWYSNNTSNNNIVLAEFGWNYVINYYDYPFDNITKALLYNKSISIIARVEDLFPPDNHINESGVNKLREIKKKYDSEMYIIFEDDYIIDKGFELFGRLTPEQSEEYYNLVYLNKICSSKTEDNREIPLFWVI